MTKDINISALRNEYTLAELNEDMVGANPIVFFNRWFEEARSAALSEVNAMSLATADAQGRPHVRTVLLKGVDDNKAFVFYTNYNSAKGRQISQNSQVALLFFWKELERQVRIEGIVEKTEDIISESYFDSRPIGSKISAFISNQSEKISSRKLLEESFEAIQKQYADGKLPRPKHWGGFRVIPNKIEFWQGRANRLHDRIAFEWNQDEWTKYRLAP